MFVSIRVRLFRFPFLHLGRVPRRTVPLLTWPFFSSLLVLALSGITLGYLREYRWVETSGSTRARAAG